MDKPVRMGRVQRRRQLSDDVGRPCGGQRSAGIEQRAHVPAVDVAHRYEQDTASLARLEDGNDVRVVDGGCGPGFADEALPERIVDGQARGQDLQRDVPVQPEVEGAVDNRHPAAADLLLKPVPGYLRTDGELAGSQRIVLSHCASSASLLVPVLPMALGSRIS